MPGKVKEETWELTSGDTIAIPAANRADGIQNTWSDIWKYQVPAGQAHVLKPGHRIAFYLYDAAEAAAGSTRVRIEIRDQSEQDKSVIFGPALYTSLKEFQQDDKMARLALQKDIALGERFFLVVVIYDTNATGLDESASYFKIETIRIRSSI